MPSFVGAYRKRKKLVRKGSEEEPHEACMTKKTRKKRCDEPNTLCRLLSLTKWRLIVTS